MGDREGSPRLIFTTGIYLEGGGGALPPQICVTNLFRLILKTGHACRGFYSTCTWASSENSSRNSNVLYKA